MIHGNLDGATLQKMIDQVVSLPKPEPMVAVAWIMVQPGKAFMVREDGLTYAFIHPDDLADFAGLPVRPIDDEMREVFLRAIDRRTAAESPPAPAQVYDFKWPAR